jgi:hypothetical protein
LVLFQQLLDSRISLLFNRILSSHVSRYLCFGGTDYPALIRLLLISAVSPFVYLFTFFPSRFPSRSFPSHLPPPTTLILALQRLFPQHQLATGITVPTSYLAANLRASRQRLPIIPPPPILGWSMDTSPSGH